MFDKYKIVNIKYHFLGQDWEKYRAVFSEGEIRKHLLCVGIVGLEDKYLERMRQLQKVVAERQIETAQVISPTFS